MKIKNVFLLVTDITLDGGVERVVCNMANHFANIGCHVVIISMFSLNDSVKYKLAGNVKIEILKRQIGIFDWLSKNTFGPSIIRRYQAMFAFTKLIYAVVEKYAANEKSVLLSNSYLYTTPLYRRSNTIIIGLDHSRYPFGNKTRGFKHWLHTYMIKKFDVVTTLNEEELDKWKSIGPPVYVMPNFIPQSMIDKVSNCIEREKIILSMGRMNTDQKGFDRLIEAYSMIAEKHSDWKLMIYGSGKLQRQYKEQIVAAGMQRYIVINDFTEEPQRAYNEASIYAMCSREEGFSMVLLEAGIHGLPLVAYDIDFGPSTIIKDGETGFVVPNGDSEAYAERLEQLINDENLRMRMSENVKRDIPARYSENVIMDKWENLIDSFL